ncbi:hypothetical protein HDA32_004703 [Spinactinospora alkalitolerans]|uniref:DUF3068 domain-containing protein n=1 Tax=Spinactinospora alkalitolerans TaxID=687207 RepID=A0A852U3U1_9ACTN|nr:DUF3068 domain-containing protein [Spinactinospora alkalitolerans]NYE49583.1 hypothetical protein [Spinactinospora alkalitolerans]
MTAAVRRERARTGDGAAPPPRPPGSLRRNLGLLLVAAGAFLLTLAPLLRFHVHPQMAALPGDLDAVWQLEDESGSYLDTTTWETRDDVDIARRTELTGRVTPGNPDWVTWEMSVDTASSAGMIDHVDRRVIVDRSTAMAVNCCGEHVDGDRAVRQAGLVLRWPAGAEAEEYPFYDADVRAAPPMRLEAVDEVGGLAARRYVQTVEPAQVPDSAHEVPAEVMGLDRSGTVRVTRWVELVRTYWVEPVSGDLLDAAEQRRETLRTGDGGAERVALEADLSMPDHRIGANVDNAERRAGLLTLTRSTLPAAFAAFGVLLALTGLARTGTWARRGHAEEDGEGPAGSGSERD